MRTGVKRARLRWTIGIVCVLLAVGYLIGGSGGYARLARNIRARVSALLEPPTPQEIQRAVSRDSMDAQAATTAVQRARNETAAGRPASRGQMIAGLGGILIGTFGLMFLTARRKP